MQPTAQSDAEPMAVKKAGWLALLGLFLMQILLGAATVWTDFAPALKSVHLVAATLVWVALIYLAALQFAVRRSEPGGQSP